MLRFDPAGYPFIGVSVGLALVAGYAVTPWLSLPFLALAAFFLFFFRDPDRTAATRPDAVLSPADGRVLVAGPAVPGAAPAGEWQQISIFLSPMNVHVNRVPVSGRVTRVSYTPGKYLPAYAHEDKLPAFVCIQPDATDTTSLLPAHQRHHLSAASF